LTEEATVGGYQGPTADDIDRTPYVNGEDVEVIEYGNVFRDHSAYGAECRTHGVLMNGDWHSDKAKAIAAVQEHLDRQHKVTLAQALDTVIFLARTFLAPDASDSAEVWQAEILAESSLELVCELRDEVRKIDGCEPKHLRYIP
jgi:hypothetical protein